MWHVNIDNILYSFHLCTLYNYIHTCEGIQASPGDYFIHNYLWERSGGGGGGGGITVLISRAVVVKPTQHDVLTHGSIHVTTYHNITKKNQSLYYVVPPSIYGVGVCVCT